MHEKTPGWAILSPSALRLAARAGAPAGSIALMAGGEPVLDSPRLATARERLTEAIRALNAAADAIEHAPDDADFAPLQQAFDEAEAGVTRAREDVERLERVARSRADNPPPDPAPTDPPDVRVTNEPRTYERWNVRNSYWLDLARVQSGRGDRDAARTRLERHRDETAEEVRRREQAAQRRTDAELDRLVAGLPPALAQQVRGAILGAEQRDITRTDGAGGEFVPPLWMLDEYAALARAGRPLADLVRQVPLPPGTDSINIPRIATGAAVAAQTADNAAVSEVDITTGSVAAPVITIAGQQDVALQLLEQSPIAFDQVIFEDLIADYAVKIDVQVISGTAASGQLRGILNTSGINTVTYTDASPTMPELWPKIADALNQAQTGRILPAQAIVMHPRRWYWMVAALDVNNRPWVVPAANGPTNAQGVLDLNAPQGPVGTLMGMPVFLDASLPTNQGAGTNEDVILVLRVSDSILFEGALRTRVLMEVLSGTLTVRLQVYAYVAFTAGRYPAGVSKIGGTGLVTPTF